MMGPAADMLDPVLGQFLFKPGGASPVGVLVSIVGEHLFGHPVFADGPAVGLNDIFCALAAVKSQSGDVAAVVVDKPDQISVLARQPEGQNIALPHLVGPGPLEKPGLGRVLFRLAFYRLAQAFFVQGSLDG